MSAVMDYRQRLIDETSDLSPSEMEKIYEAEDHIYLRNIGGHDILP